ncbi:MAG: hypothetical protein VX672_05605, partial [Planctomycetota bacterium]|nr:hypothetical protein [Planctomycetota bacterium]
MMLRTLAAFSLGTLAASTAVASLAMTEARSAGRSMSSPASTPVSESTNTAPTLAESILARRDIDPSTGKRPEWSKTAQRLIDAGILEELAAGAASVEATARARAAGIERGRHEVVLPAIEIAKTPNDSIVVPYNLDGTPAATGRIHLKYRNGLGARASISGTTPVLSVAGQPLGGINQLLAAERAVVKQLIQHPENVIESVRKKAFDRSGRVQPDLAAMMVVELPGPVNWDRVLRVARSLNDIAEIEWVALAPTVANTQDCGEAPTGNTFCNLPRNTGPKTLYAERIACELELVFDPGSMLVPPTIVGLPLCENDQFNWLQSVSAELDARDYVTEVNFDFTNYWYNFSPQNAPGSWPGDLTVPASPAGQANWAAAYPLGGIAWGDPGAPNFGFDGADCLPPLVRTGCQDVACCDLVAAFLPECADATSANGWDAFCAATANILCAGTIYDNINPNTPEPERYDPCLSTYRPSGSLGAPGAPQGDVVIESDENCPPPNGGFDDATGLATINEQGPV